MEPFHQYHCTLPPTPQKWCRLVVWSWDRQKLGEIHPNHFLLIRGLQTWRYFVCTWSVHSSGSIDPVWCTDMYTWYLSLLWGCSQENRPSGTDLTSSLSYRLPQTSFCGCRMSRSCPHMHSETCRWSVPGCWLCPVPAPVGQSPGRPGADRAGQITALSKYCCPGGSWHSGNSSHPFGAEAASLAADCTMGCVQTGTASLPGAAVHHSPNPAFNYVPARSLRKFLGLWMISRCLSPERGLLGGGDRAFSRAANHESNSLPLSIRTAPSLAVFKSRLYLTCSTSLLIDCPVSWVRGRNF